MKIEDISSRLHRSAIGIYTSDSTAEISYESDGHNHCFSIEESSFWFSHRNDCIAALLQCHPFVGTMLDLGGGNGYVTQRIIAEGWDAILLEPGKAGALNASRHRNLDPVVCSTIEDAGFTPGVFGAIGLFDVIEHIDSDREFLELITPLLSQGGRLYMTVPCHSWLWSHTDVAAGHFRRHTLGTLNRLLDGLYSIDYASYFFGPLIIPHLVARAIPYRLAMTPHKSILPPETEHGLRNGLSVKLLRSLLRTEARAIREGRCILYGASALLVATAL